MPKLSNDLLREKTMKEFLTAMGVDVTGVEVSSIEGLFSFSFKEDQQAERFANQLNGLIQLEGITKSASFINLSQLLTAI